MILDNLLKELELLLSDIAFAGVRNVLPVTLQKMEELKHWMKELGMSEGMRRIDAFSASVRKYQAGEGTAEEAVSCLCALECYQKTVSGLQNL